MKLRSRPRAMAALGLARVGHAAVVTVEQSLQLNHPTQGLVYNIATDARSNG
jgi:hypothetical protein